MNIPNISVFIISHRVVNELCYLVFMSLASYIINPHFFKEILFCCSGHDEIVTLEIFNCV